MVKNNVRTAVVTGFGINSDRELVQAFRLAGAEAAPVHITTLLENPELLRSQDMLAFPGGFSYGDHLGSGRVFSQLVKKNLKPALTEFVAAGKPIIGICNGFQMLVKMGILPNLEGDWTPETTLVNNEGGCFIDKWVTVKYNPASPCIWTKGLDRSDLPIRHGEGRFVVRDEGIQKQIRDKNLVALRYTENPNGSLDDIAGLTDPTGLIFGLMPHPEAFSFPENHPQWRSGSVSSLGLKIFQNAVEWVRAQKGV